MAIRISGINLPDNKQISIALTHIYGIGRPMALTILKQLKIEAGAKTRDLTSTEENQLREYVEKHIKVEGELRRETSMHIKHLKDINCYRGVRHAKHLPARGQRTRTNTRTVRGNVRRTAGSGRRASAEKT